MTSSITLLFPSSSSPINQICMNKTPLLEIIRGSVLFAGLAPASTFVPFIVEIKEFIAKAK